MGLAAVRDLRPQLRLETADEVEAFEQDLLAEFVLARASAGITDATIRADVAAVVGLREWFGRPLWEMAACDLDRFFGADQRAMAAGTKVRKAAAFAVFFEFLELRHKPAIHAATGFVVESPLDEVNRPRGGTSARLRIPPGEREIGKLFTGWRTDLLILLHGKGSRGRGKKDRLVPLINGSRDLLEWWAGGPRWEFDGRVNDPAAPLFPSERRHGDGSSRPVTDDALRLGLAEAVAAHLPGQAGRLTPHLLRHYAASELYRNGMDVFGVQEVLGHEWINTTMIYVHVHRSHVEDAWVQAGRRAAGRLGGERP